MSDDDDRIERLIASNEAQANAINRLVQVLERQEAKKRIKATRVRRAPRAVEVTERAQVGATNALARVRARQA